MTDLCPTLAARLRGITAFLLENRGRCFPGWPSATLFRFAAWHWLNGTLFAAYDSAGQPALVAIAWLADFATVQARARRGEPLFDWQSLPLDGDTILIADVVGNRKFTGEIIQQVHGVWPDSPRKRLLTHRRGRLVELSWPTLVRFQSL
jgi:hypothetical protein